MKKIIKTIVMCLVFIVALVFFSITTNQTNEDLTTTLKEAELPTLGFIYQDVPVDELHGYVQEMDMTKMRDCILPVGDDRIVNLEVRTHGAVVDKIAYAIRSMDGTRLMADGTVEQYDKQGTKIEASFELQNILEKNTEYMLLFTLTSGDKNIYYYTRIMQTTAYYPKECMEFALKFHDYTFRDDAGNFIPTYMDPATGDATTLNYVDLSCTLRQITWADLKGEVLNGVSTSFKEINDSYNVLTLNYILTHENDLGEIEYYNVEEYYRLRMTDTRMYVLNFERTINEIFRKENTFITDGKNIQLGIRKPQVEYKVNEAGDVVAFVQEGDLWCYNGSANELAQVYSFRSVEGMDERESWMQHDISIVCLDEAGSVDFIVYGYMNRGDHEGEVGIGIYHYDGLSHIVEEEAFIPVTQSYEVLKAELGRLLYQNDQSILYLMMNGEVFRIDLASKSVKSIVSGLENGCYATSESGQYIAWVDGENQYKENVIHLMDLKTEKVNDIREGTGDCLRPLDFIDEDFVYGIANQEDVDTDASGNVEFKMKSLKIIDTSEDSTKVLKSYTPQNRYISGVQIQEHTMIVNLLKKEDGQYVDAGTDSIMNREADTEEFTEVVSTVTDIKQTQMQIVLKNEPKKGPGKKFASQMLQVEEDTLITVATEETKDRFYVYVKGDVTLATDSISEAILQANKDLGVVVDAKQQYVWMRAHKSSQTSLGGVEPSESDMQANTVVKCVSAMLNRAGVGTNVSQLMNTGMTAREVLENTLQDSIVLDLTGTTANEIVYYVSNGSPVFAMTDDNHAVLVVGYTSDKISYYDPSENKVKFMDLEDAVAWFGKAGNVFISYLPIN